MSSEKKLNKEQLLATTHGTGPLLIIAGAGTGKTTVITERVKWLISQKLSLPEEILALTFTEKSAREMEERIDVALPLGYTSMYVMTFHSFCDRLLRDEGLHIGLSTNYKLLTEADSVSLLKTHLFELPLSYFRPLGNPTKFLSAMLQHFSRLQDEDITEETYLSWAQKQPDLNSADPALKIEAEKFLELAQIYSQYSQIKSKNSVLDFGDLISLSLKLLRARPNLLKNYQHKFKFVLVDEFQDTNFAQNQLVSLLAGKKANLTVVADDDQSIYRWRGAAVSNVIQFRTNYPKSRLVVLTQNYRSTQQILDRSYDFIQNNNPDRLEIKEKINKKLKSSRSQKGETVRYLHLNRVENEADAVSKEIKRLIDNPDNELTPKDFAILVRANSHAEPFTRSLSRYDIPFQFLGPGQLFQQPEVKDLISYLKILSNLEDDPSVYRVLSMEYFAISQREIADLGIFAKRYNLHLFNAAEIIIQNKPSENMDLPELSKDFINKLDKLIALILKHLSLVANTSAGQILYDFLSDSGLLQAIANYVLPYDEKKTGNIMKFFNKLKSFEIGNIDNSVTAVVDWIELSAEVGESPAAVDNDWTENNSVNILTIHSAKGLEFPVVFMVNLVSQRFPSTERHETLPIPEALIQEILPAGNYHLQEERRLFYVGMTRARDLLYFTGADYYGEGKRAKKPSPFIAEALGDISSTTTVADLQLSLLDWHKSLPVSNSTAPSRKTQVDYLSYSQIQTFLECPIHYKAKYLLKLPSHPSAALSFGNTIHHSLREFYESVRQNETPDIMKIYEHNWIREGYLHKKQSEEYFQKGEKYLKTYIKNNFNPKSLPLILESPFTVSLGDLKIGGRIDRVDALPGGRIEIIDYKTSNKSLTDKEAATDLQLSFYALAATLLPFSPFPKKPEEIVLSLYYFEDQKKVSTTRSIAQLDSAKAEILECAEKIKLSDFKCSGSIYCKNCDFKMLCDIPEVDF